MIVAIEFLKSVVLPVLGKYWKYIAVALLALVITFYVKHRVDAFAKANYDAGYQQATLVYQAQIATLQKQYQAQQVAQQAAYNTQLAKAIDDANKTVQKAEDAADAAQALADANQRKANDFESKWKETLNHVQFSAPAPGHPDGINDYPFNIAFVGMFNLAVQDHLPDGSTASPAGSSLTPAQVSTAAYVDGGSTWVDLSKGSAVSIRQVLETTSKNMAIANKCIAERKEMKTYIDQLCKLGFCE